MPAFRRDALGFMLHCARTYGDIVPLRFGPRRAFLLNNPDDIEEVLVTQYRHFSKGPALRRSAPLFGNGLLTSEGDFWRRQRKLAQPAFHRERIAAYAQIMVDETQARIAAWKVGEQRDIHQEMVSLTLPIAVKTLFGAELEKSEHIGDMLELAQTNFERWIHYITMLPSWVPTPSVPGLTRAIKELDRIVYHLIAQRRAENEAGNNKAANGAREQDKGDLLSMLLRARDEESGQTMTDKQLRDEVLTLFLAGHDTTALTLTWTLYLLAQNPDVETKLRAELESVVGNRAPTASDRPNLKYAEQVIQESMRLYPPAWVVGRSVIESCTVGGQALAVGNTVIMGQWVVHRDPRWFADPETFRPERWENDFARTLPRYAYFPFGGGPRVCIGNTFAMMESVLVLVTVLQKWRLELVPNQNIVLQPAVTLRPKHGIQMKVRSAE
jgi:cytochrome P450